MIALRNLKKDIYRSMMEPGYAMNTLRKRFACYLDYKFASRPRFFPESVTFFLTHRCNLRCRMCGQSKITDTTGELDLDGLKKVVNDIAPFRPNITLYGGEPFLYKDIERLVEHIKSRGLHISIITNGTFLDKYAESIVRNGVDILSVSIDGPPGIHDEIRGVSGTFEKIKKGILNINKRKNEYKKKKPFINIVTTISNLNCLHLEEMVKIALDLDIATLNFHHLIFVDKNTAWKQNNLYGSVFGKIACDWEGFTLNEIEGINADILIEKIEKIKSAKLAFLVNFYPNFTAKEIRGYYSREEFLAAGYKRRCLSPWMTAYIYPDGSVRPCLAVDYAAGDVRRESFLRIWKNDRFNQFRKKLKKINLFPVCPKCTEFYRY